MKYTPILFFILLISIQQIDAQVNNEFIHTYTDSSQTMDFSNLRFTVYTLKPYYVEINLVTQKGYLHSRDGKVKVFGISSGTDKVQDGINTKEGLFVVQAKLPKWYSRQFDSTLMLNWIGFNFGIGFHALQTSGYYTYLGKKKSSHGCIRVSRKIAKELYDLIDKGTPILVHSEDNIIQLGFADSTKKYEQFSYNKLYYIINNVYKKLYTGRFLINKYPYIVLNLGNVDHNGLKIGNTKNILKRQIISSQYEFVKALIPDYKGVMPLEVHEDFSAYNIKD